MEGHNGIAAEQTDQPDWTSPEARLRAVLERDHRAAGHFLYGVKSTGVFCNPGCASRTPKPENVRLFDRVEEAGEAGYRPCRRCWPEQPSTPEMGTAEQKRAELQRLQEICSLLAEEEPVLSVAEVAGKIGITERHLRRLFRVWTGVTPAVWRRGARLRRFMDGLGEAGSVTEALYEAGFGSAAAGYGAARLYAGMTPAAMRKGGDMQRIDYSLGACSLGRLLVARTGKGICAIEPGDSDVELRAGLARRFGRAELRDVTGLAEADGGFDDLVREIAGMFVHPDRLPDIPLDVMGTAFQQQVWEALRRIPPGETCSYSDLAASLGKPSAVRAVASAVAANPLALINPCHRVVGKDGKLHGFRWGLERKQAMLERECSPAPASDLASSNQDR